MAKEMLPDGWERPKWDERTSFPSRVLGALRRGLVRQFASDLQDPAGAQLRALSRVLDSARDTAFGRAYGLAKVRKVEDYRRAVPVQSFMEHQPWLEQVWRGETSVLSRHRVTGFVKSSGTTGAPKRLPVNEVWSTEIADAQFLWLLAMLAEQPEVSGGFALATVGKYPEAHSPAGIPIGANTGRMAMEQPFLVKSRYVVPREVWAIEDPDVRTYVALRIALARDIRTWTTANPSTLLAWSRAMLRWREDLSADLVDGTLTHGPAAMLDAGLRRRLWGWAFRKTPPTDFRPGAFWRLAAVNCWKGGFAPYFVERLPAALGFSGPIREVGITASEGYFAIPLHSSWWGGVAWGGGHFLEFVPEEGGEPCLLSELQIGARYRLVISTTAGLYRYDLEDVVKVVGWYSNTPLLTFCGKTQDTLSVVGEKVTVAQLASVMATFGALGGFSVGVGLAERPWYELWVEGDVDPVLFDQRLSDINAEYADRRATDRLGLPTVRRVPEGTWAQWRNRRLLEGVAEGQLKEPIFRRGSGPHPGVLPEG